MLADDDVVRAASCGYGWLERAIDSAPQQMSYEEAEFVLRASTASFAAVALVDCRDAIDIQQPARPRHSPVRPVAANWLQREMERAQKDLAV